MWGFLLRQIPRFRDMLSARLSLMPRAAAILLAALSTPALAAQTSQPMPRDYRSPQVHIDGVWVTPVPGAPFTATVQIVSHNKLPDGTEHVVKTENQIARSSSGRIRNERRQLVPAIYAGQPRLLSAHIYDPDSRVNIFTDTATRIARQTILPQPLHTPAAQAPPAQQRKDPAVTETQLGEQTLDDIQLTGIRKTRIIPADRSGTGDAVTITDDYWYSAALSIYLIIKHNDPRTGEQLVAVTHIQRGEPAEDLLRVPDDYKVVDETPPPPSVSATHQ
jgi:hypothetical protein